MINYKEFSADWKGRAAYCATLSLGAIAVFLSVFLIAQTVAAFQAVSLADDVTYGPSVSVRGTGKVVATSTEIVGSFTYGVRSTSESVATAKEESAKANNAIVAYLREQGIDEKDMKTVAYSIYPNETWISEPCPIGTYCNGGRSVVTGYTVHQSVLVKVRDTAKSGDILAGIGERGVTDVSSFTFSVDEPDALRDAARAEAIADAKERAEVLADSLGVKLGRIVGMYEHQEGPVYPMDGYGGARDMMVSEFKVAPSVPVGEQEISVTVEIQYAIEQ